MEYSALGREEFYFKLNQDMYEGNILGEYYGSRYIVNGLDVLIRDWSRPFPTLEEFGYPSQQKRLARLKRNYFEQVSHDQARALFDRKIGDTSYTGAPLSYTTNKIKQTGNLGCLVGGAITFKNPPRSSPILEADFLFRISEAVKVLPGDLVFPDRCLRYSIPATVVIPLKTVRLHFSGAYVVPGFFPQLLAMRYSRGKHDQKIELPNNTFGRACTRALEQSCDPLFRPKWKPQIRIFNFFRRTVPKEHLSLLWDAVSLV